MAAEAMPPSASVYPIIPSGSGQADRHRCPAAEFTFYGEHAAVQVDDGFRKRQPETSPLMRAVEHRIYAIERLYHQRDVLAPDANSGIPDANIERGVVDFARYRDAPPCRRELYRVANQVDKNLLQFDRVAFEHRPVLRITIDNDFDCGRRRSRLQHH